MAVIIVVGCIGFMAFALMSLRDTGPNRDSGVSSITPAPTNSNPGIIKTQEGNITSLQYNSEIFSVSYPEGFKVISVTPTDGIQEYMRFVSPTSKEISVVVFPRQNNTIDDLSKPYQSANYENRELTQNDMTGRYFEGKNAVLRLHEKVALFQKGYSIIRFQLSYSGEADSTIEAQYDAMLATLR